MCKIWFILNYPIPFHDNVTPKLGLKKQNQYCFSKWDTGNVSAKMKTFVKGQKKGLILSPHFGSEGIL